MKRELWHGEIEQLRQLFVRNGAERIPGQQNLLCARHSFRASGAGSHDSKAPDVVLLPRRGNGGLIVEDDMDDIPAFCLLDVNIGELVGQRKLAPVDMRVVLG